MERRLAAILAADVVGFSHLVGVDEVGTIQRLKAMRGAIVEPKVGKFKGSIFKTTGDGFLAEFPSVVYAISCAVEIQTSLRERNDSLPMRMGINVGDVISDEGDLLGDGVNVAARLESAAPSGGILISGAAREQVANRLEVRFDDLGFKSLKNIETPIRTYLIRLDEKGAEQSSRVASDKPSIALLPFLNLGADPEQDILADGITENVVMGLSRFRDLIVIASSSSFAFKGKTVKAQDASRDLGARYILEGKVQKAGDRVRISAQLIDGHNGRLLWSERYDRQIDDVFAIQDEVTEHIISSLATSYGGRLIKAWKERPERTGTRSLQALDYFIRGMELLNRTTKEDNFEARKLFTRSGELDPGFGKAFAKLAWTYLNEASEGWSDDPEATRDQALKFAKLAIERDGAESWGHYALGGYYLFRRQFDRCIAEFDRALEMNPNDPDVLTDFGIALSYAGQSKRALEASLKGRRLNPYHPEWYLPLLGHVYYDAGLYEEAISTLESVREIDTVYLRMYLASSYAAVGRPESAIKSVERITELEPGATVISITTLDRAPYARSSDVEKLRDHLRLAGLLG